MFQIKELLKLNIEEEIPLVIKAQDQSAEIADREISQYIVTRQIEEHLERFLEKYLTTSTDKIGVWISGFFGWVSHTLKILGFLQSIIFLRISRLGTVSPNDYQPLITEIFFWVNLIHSINFQPTLYYSRS